MTKLFFRGFDSDSKTIKVNNGLYQEKRYKFGLVHEIGHCSIHDGAGEVFNIGEYDTVQYKYKSVSGQPLCIRKKLDSSYEQDIGDIMTSGRNNRAGNMYPGSKNPQVRVGDELVDDYRREVLNEVDLSGYNHDKGYDSFHAVGSKAAMFDKIVRGIDQQIIDASKEVRRKYRKGENDIVAGLPITKQMHKEAGKIKAVFQIFKVFKSVFGSKNINYDKKDK